MPKKQDLKNINLSDSPEYEEYGYLIKSINEERCFIFALAESLTPSHAYRFKNKLRTTEKSAYTIYADGYIERSAKKSSYSPEETEHKRFLSQAQSATLVFPEHECPTFGFNARRDKLAGVIIPWTPEDVLTNRCFTRDCGTVRRPYDFEDKAKAKAGFNHFVKDNKMLYKNKAEFKQALLKKGLKSPTPYNEVLARMRWNINNNPAIMIASDTFEARALAFMYSQVIRENLKRRAREMGEDFPQEYEVPVLYYLPDSEKHLQAYSEAELEKDLEEAYLKQNSYSLLFLAPDEKNWPLILEKLNHLKKSHCLETLILEQPYIFEFLLRQKQAEFLLFKKQKLKDDYLQALIFRGCTQTLIKVIKEKAAYLNKNLIEDILLTGNYALISAIKSEKFYKKVKFPIDILIKHKHYAATCVSLDLPFLTDKSQADLHFSLLERDYKNAKILKSKDYAKIFALFEQLNLKPADFVNSFAYNTLSLDCPETRKRNFLYVMSKVLTHKERLALYSHSQKQQELLNNIKSKKKLLLLRKAAQNIRDEANIEDFVNILNPLGNAKDAMWQTCKAIDNLKTQAKSQAKQELLKELTQLKKFLIQKGVNPKDCYQGKRPTRTSFLRENFLKPVSAQLMALTALMLRATDLILKGCIFLLLITITITGLFGLFGAILVALAASSWAVLGIALASSVATIVGGIVLMFLFAAIIGQCEKLLEKLLKFTKPAEIPDLVFFKQTRAKNDNRLSEEDHYFTSLHQIEKLLAHPAKAYKNGLEFLADLLQPLIGIKDIAAGFFKLLTLPCMLWFYPKETRSKEFNEPVNSILKGFVFVLSCPFTYLVRIPQRLGKTLISACKNEPKPAKKSLLNKIEKAQNLLEEKQEEAQALLGRILKTQEQNELYRLVTRIRQKHKKLDKLGAENLKASWQACKNSFCYDEAKVGFFKFDSSKKEEVKEFITQVKALNSI